MTLIDLHLHTTFSDGQHTPDEVVNLAVQAGVTAMAITDHDTMNGVIPGAEAAKSFGIRFLSGIEISCTGNRELHILGYNVNTADVRLSAACRDFARFRDERAVKIIEYLKNKDVDISLDDVNAAAEHITLIGRSHFALAMVNKGYVKTTREAFDKYLGTAEFDSVERPKPAAAEGIDMIAGAGGVPVLAHPALLKLDDGEFEKLLRDLIYCGLRGLECHYSLHKPEQTAFYGGLARKYGLIVTGGSDFHGEKFKPGIKIGTGLNGSLRFEDMEVVEWLCGKS